MYRERTGNIQELVKKNREWASDLGGSEAISKGLKMYQIVGDVEDGLGGVGGGSRGRTLTISEDYHCVRYVPCCLFSMFML